MSKLPDFVSERVSILSTVNVVPRTWVLVSVRPESCVVLRKSPSSTLPCTHGWVNPSHPTNTLLFGHFYWTGLFAPASCWRLLLLIRLLCSDLMPCKISVTSSSFRVTETCKVATLISKCSGQFPGLLFIVLGWEISPPGFDESMTHRNLSLKVSAEFLRFLL